MKEITFTERSSYFNFFRKYIMTCYTPFEGTPVKGLQVLGFLETRNLRFDRVFILDANEEVLRTQKKKRHSCRSGRVRYLVFRPIRTETPW